MLKRKKGFTLIELIIVIVIIGILAAISIIGYTSQAVKARDNAAFVGLTEAVKAANVCLANGDTLTVFSKAELVAGVNAAGISQLCTPATGSTTTSAVAGVWPKMAAIGGNWKYVEYDPAGSSPSDTVILNGITAGAVSIATASPPPSTALASGDHGVSCALSGCNKWGF